MGKERAPQRTLGAATAAVSMRFANLDKALRLPAGGLEARRFARDRHWNAAGHRAVAAALAEAIEPRLRDPTG